MPETSTELEFNVDACSLSYVPVFSHGLSAFAVVAWMARLVRWMHFPQTEDGMRKMTYIY